MVADEDWLSLEPDETIVWWGQPRLRRILPAVGQAALGAAFFLAVAVVGPSLELPGVPPLAITAGGILLAIGATGAALRAYLRTRNVYYVLTDRNVYLKRGVLSTTVSRVGVANVQNTRLTKSVLGRLFDYGTVEVSSAGSSGADLVVSDLDDPETFRDELQRLMGESQPAPAGAPSALLASLHGEVGSALLEDARAMRHSAERLQGAIVE